MNTNIDINIINNLAIEAGKAILDVYWSDDFEIELKDDDSPLTKADKISNKIITAGLRSKFPNIPIISEEEKSIAYEVRKNWNRFFLVDPLDGTKEFIKRNGEFTVNIALIENRFPVLGVIYAPVLETLYYGIESKGAFRIKDKKKIQLRTNGFFDDGIIAVQSRSHSGEEEEKFLNSYNVINSTEKGSSLKFCIIAEAEADIYYRAGPTMEWDTAAGQAILEAAGGYVMKGTKRFVYNKLSLRNPGFCCYASDLLINEQQAHQ